MADVNKAIEVVFAGVDDMSQTIAKIGGGLNDFSGDLQSVTQPLANMGTDILKLEAALVALTAPFYLHSGDMFYRALSMPEMLVVF